eukprot:3300798-Pleurochrysis_carterae.AAC.1
MSSSSWKVQRQNRFSGAGRCRRGQLEGTIAEVSRRGQRLRKRGAADASARAHRFESRRGEGGER